MSEQGLSVFTGRIRKLGIVVEEGVRSELEARGYGVVEDGRFLLRDYEALYLKHIGKLEVYQRGKKLNHSSLVSYALDKDKNAVTRFLIYMNLRSRGYVARDGFGFGVDFRVYDKGDFSLKPAKYVVFGLNEGTEDETSSLPKMIDEITRMGKEAIIGVLERRGEVIYYKVSRTRMEPKPKLKEFSFDPSSEKEHQQPP